MTPLIQSRKEPVDVTFKFTLQSFHFESTWKFKLFRPCVATSLEKSRGHKTGPCGTPSQLIRVNEKTSKASFSSQPVDSSSASETHEVLGCFHPTSKTTARIRLSNAAVNAHLQREGKDSSLFRLPQASAARKLPLGLRSFETQPPLVLFPAVYILPPPRLMGKTGFTSTQQTTANNNNNNCGNTTV